MIRIGWSHRCWAPPGIRPHAPAQLIRESVDVFAAVAPVTGEVVSLILLLWDELREKYLHNRAFSSLEALIEVLCWGLNDLADDPAALRSLTGFPHIINVKL